MQPEQNKRIQNVTAGELARRLNAELRGIPHRPVVDAQSVGKAGADDVTFVADARNLRELQRSRAGTVIVGAKLAHKLEDCRTRSVLIVEEPRDAFLQVLDVLRPRRQPAKVGVSATAVVSPSARIGEDSNVYPGAFLGEDVTIGSRCTIYPGVYIGPGCRLGDDVTLFPNVVLYPDVTIGDRVAIHASAVVGADGFGYRLVEGRHEKIPHFGTVRIEDDVEIGACTTIDRAMIGETVIGQGTKLDNMVMVAHNCELGRHNVMVAQVGLAGSVTTGDYVTCAGQVGVADHVHLGAGCVLGSKAGVPKDVPAGETYIGIPAQPAAEAVKVAMTQKKLPEIRKDLRQLEAKVAELTARLGWASELEKPAA